MFEAALLLSFGTKMRTDGVAAALQSGGACTLFAEAAGAQGLSLPEFSAATKRTLRKALPHFASQNNPLDVTGQAAVETDMFCAALEALAHDPAVGLVAFDAFPPREEGEDVWAEPILRGRATLRKETGVVFASVAMGPLAYGTTAKRFVARRAAAVPAGASRGGRRDPRAGRAPGRRARASVPDLPPHPDRAKALRLLRGLVGSARRGARPARCSSCTACGGPRSAAAATPAAAATAARAIGFPVAVKALAPELPHKAKLGGVRLGLDEPDRRGGGRRRGARGGAAGRRRRAAGARPADGDGHRGARRRGRRRAVRRLHHDAARRGAGRGGRGGVRRRARSPARRRSRSSRAQAARVRPRPEDRHDLRAVARAVEAIARAAHDLRDRLTSLEANPLLVERARRGRRGRARGSRASGVIFGLVAALGWGLADFEGAIAGRRIGSLWTVILGQTLSAVVMTVVVPRDGRAICPSSARVIGFVVAERDRRRRPRTRRTTARSSWGRSPWCRRSAPPTRWSACCSPWSSSASGRACSRWSGAS